MPWTTWTRNASSIFSRDELKQYEARQLFGDDPRLRWFIGDVRDLDRLRRAMHGVDYVVHAAALKQVDTAEYNPFEYVQTNVDGSQNVVDAAIDCGVRRSSRSPPTRRQARSTCTARPSCRRQALHLRATTTRRTTRPGSRVVRYGNVMGSRGLGRAAVPQAGTPTARACRSPTSG